MIKLLLPLSLVLMFSCAHKKHVDRGFASVEDQTELEGTLLGYVKYTKEVTRYKKRAGGKVKKKYKKTVNDFRAARVYFRKAKENDGSYNVVLMEYVNLLKMAPKYILSNKAPIWVNKRVGYLNQILSRTMVYKALPTSDPKVYELQKVKVVNGQLQTENVDNPSLVKLAKDPSEENPLWGASITASENGEPVEFYFPPNNGEDGHGMQFMLARFVYNLIDGFKSTWRTTYLPGDYLGAYGDKNDVILQLNSDNNKDSANFFINEKRAKRLSKKKREKQLTNAKSAYISGDYTVTEADDGIFIFNANSDSEHQGSEHVDQRIGLFVDIFDASETRLNQDVVELIVVDQDEPSDFLMYYEHPDNGEGR